MVTREDVKNKTAQSIVIKVETKKRIEGYSTNMKDTYDSLLNRLMDFYDTHKE